LIDSKEDILTQLLNNCHQQNIQSILVEGGAKLLQSFINANLWDEARVITNNALSIREGLDAPQLSNVKLFQEEKILDDTIRHYLPAS
jgi:diaminohydroxyphosphoribosylaminopyrimidine deaminase/5-amino-6-(5-phosphoribosylamino)uracil reductase